MARPIRVLANAQQAIDRLITSGPQTPPELAEAIGIPRSSAYRLLDGLAAVDLVAPVEGGRFAPSVRWLHLAHAARSALPAWTAQDAAIEALVARTGLTCYLALPRPDGAVCIDWREGRGVGLLMLRPGGTLPANAGALGRLVLAFGDGGTEAVLGRLEPERFTPTTLVAPGALREDAERTRQQGFVLSDGDVTTGVAAVGVPVLSEGRLVAVVSAGGLSIDVVARVDALAAALEETATQIAVAYRSAHPASAT